MTERERRSMTTAALLLTGAALIRYLAAPAPAEPPLADRSSVADSLIDAGDSALAEKERRSRPFAAGETIDPNVAGEEDLDRLPGVGAATARRIVEDRQTRGPFASVDDLARVRGIGPATVERMRSALRVAGAVRTGSGTDMAAGRSSLAAVERRVDPPPPPGGLTSPINVNRATAEELRALPGIGPVTAERIVAHRRANGSFQSKEDLVKVQGIGERTLERIAPMVTVHR